MVRDLGSDGTAIGSEGMAVLDEMTQAGGKAGRGTEKAKKGLRFPRIYTHAGVSPYDEVEWDLRTAAIINEHGKIVFEQKDVEFPKFWSQMATNVVASKYFRGQMGATSPRRWTRRRSRTS
jgi:ribonucleoside-diphosphate reductase alpha chain